MTVNDPSCFIIEYTFIHFRELHCFDIAKNSLVVLSWSVNYTFFFPLDRNQITDINVTPLHPICAHIFSSNRLMQEYWLLDVLLTTSFNIGRIKSKVARRC